MTPTRTLHLAKNLDLPLDAVTETFAILGRRGSGKTHTAVVMAEEMLAAGVPVVIIDPLDVWWGLRVSKDGKKAGFPIYVCGGSHQDVPLSADAGRILADVVVDRAVSMVLSLRHLSKADQRRFVGEFCERLYDRKADPAHRTALHVFIDEADAFVPQRLVPGTERCFGAVDTLVRRGRSSGLAPTLISQRPQVINKDVLSQTEVLVAHQLTGPQDRKALETWIEANDTDNRQREFMASLASLQKGHTWFWSPGMLGIFSRVHVRDRQTFDSSATPKPGVQVAAPKAFAAVDLAQLTAEISATIEKAKADDPKELRKQIAALAGELANLRKSATSGSSTSNEGPKPEVPVLTEADRVSLTLLSGQITDLHEELIERRERAALCVVADLTTALKSFQDDIRGIGTDVAAEFARVFESKGVREALNKLTSLQQPAKTANPISAPRPAAPRQQVSNPSKPAESVKRSQDDKFEPRQIRILNVLAQHADGIASGRLAILSGRPWSGGMRNDLAALRTASCIEGANTGLMRITDIGRQVLGDAFEPLPTGRELAEHWLSSSLFEPRQREILRVLLRNPDGLDARGLSGAVNREWSGGLRNDLAALRTAGVIVGKNTETMRASEELF